MCEIMEHYMAIAREEGYQEGYQEGYAEGKILLYISKLMESLNLSALQAMDALKIPAEEQPHYLELLNSEEITA